MSLSGDGLFFMQVNDSLDCNIGVQVELIY